MKNLILTIATLFTTLSANAMGFEQAREQALFLTDKMAYELNLTDDQYEAAYEINLDYLLGINSEADVFGIYWANRNLDMSYILAEWQYRAFCDALYFYRPIYWGSGYWHFRIYARYPRRTFFYFSSRPAFYHTYHGGHSWHHHGGSWYRDRHFGAAHRPGGDGRGMKDSFHNGTRNHGPGQRSGNHGGNFRNDNNRNHDMNNNRNHDMNNNRNINRSSSTRSTVHQNNSTPVRSNSNSGSSFSGGSSSRNNSGSSFSGGSSSRSNSGNSFSGGSSSRSNSGSSFSGGNSRGGGHSGGRR